MKKYAEAGLNLLCLYAACIYLCVLHVFFHLNFFLFPSLTPFIIVCPKWKTNSINHQPTCTSVASVFLISKHYLSLHWILCSNLPILARKTHEAISRAIYKELFFLLCMRAAIPLIHRLTGAHHLVLRSVHELPIE